MAPSRKRPIKRRKISPETAKHDGSDDIFRLPNHILQHLLFYLPLEDSVSMSVVSKTWKGIYDSLPVLKYKFDLDEDVVGYDWDTIDIEKFITKVNKELSFLRNHRAIIKWFRFNMDYKPSSEEEGLKLKSELNDWLSLVLKNYVKEIDFTSSNSQNNFFYTVPQSIFTSKSLVKLLLKGCKFPATLSLAGSNIQLKYISLSNVVARDDQIQELINLCRDFLENLLIKTSPPVKLLTLYDFSELCSISLNVKKLLLKQAMKLDNVFLQGVNRAYFRKADHIRTLKCMQWGNEAFGSVQGIVARLRFLETLEISMSHNQKIRIQSLSLKTLFLNEGQVFEEPLRVELNAPGLRTIKFNGFIIPSVVVYGEAQRLRCHLDRRPCSGIHGSNLHMLGKFSHNLLQSNVIIHLHEIMMMENGENVVKTLEELRNAPVQEPSCVKMLVLECIPVASDYKSFLDALFWTCHPRALAVMLTSKQSINSPYRPAFISYLINELARERVENPRCCGEGRHIGKCSCGEDRNIGKCWRHYVAEVKFSVYRYSMLEYFGQEAHHEELLDLLPDYHGHHISQNYIDGSRDSDDDDDHDDDEDHDDEEDDNDASSTDQQEEEEEEQELVVLFKIEWLPFRHNSQFQIIVNKD